MGNRSFWNPCVEISFGSPREPFVAIECDRGPEPGTSLQASRQTRVAIYLEGDKYYVVLEEKMDFEDRWAQRVLFPVDSIEFDALTGALNKVRKLRAMR